MNAKMHTIKELAARAGCNPASLRVWLSREFKIRPTAQVVEGHHTVNKYDEEAARAILAQVVSKKAEQAKRELARKTRTKKPPACR